jgi:metal-responsive CopG/Arc/MetJ family transcriptional regulator
MNNGGTFDDMKRITDIEIIVKTRKIVSLKVSEEMFEWIEEVWRVSGFSSRSDYLRALVASILEKPYLVHQANGEILPIKAEKTITFKLDSNLLQQLDELAVKKGYSTRSDLIRELIFSIMKSNNSTLP